jgi:hypothetical protein
MWLSVCGRLVCVPLCARAQIDVLNSQLRDSSSQLEGKKQTEAALAAEARMRMEAEQKLSRVRHGTGREGRFYFCGRS